MRPCTSLHCDNGKEIEYHEANGMPYTSEEDCYMCQGSGEIEDGCMCSAFCSCECCCGAWDDVQCFCWEG